MRKLERGRREAPPLLVDLGFANLPASRGAIAIWQLAVPALSWLPK